MGEGVGGTVICQLLLIESLLGLESGLSREFPRYWNVSIDFEIYPCNDPTPFKAIERPRLRTTMKAGLSLKKRYNVVVWGGEKKRWQERASDFYVRNKTKNK